MSDLRTMYTIHSCNWVVEGALDSLKKAGQPVDGNDQEVQDPAVHELFEHAEPEIRAFGCADPEPEELLTPSRGSGPAPVHRMALNVATGAGLHVDGVQVMMGESPSRHPEPRR